jgi:hypothetical protein
MKVQQTLNQNGITDDIIDIFRAITEKADGNPLYATYLSKAVLRVVDSPIGQHVSDIGKYIREAPALPYDFLFFALLSAVLFVSGIWMWLSRIKSRRLRLSDQQ